MQGFRPSALVPRGFVVVHATNDDAGTLITARAMSRTSACPGCGGNARRVHSRYRRCLADPPMAGRSVRLVVVVRRFHCDAVLCEQRIFTERFARGCAGAVGTANGQARPHRPSPRAGPGGTAGGELRPKADAAGRQRHAAARGTKAQPTTFCAADRGRDRRLGMAAQPALWDHPLRSGKAQDHRPAARSRTGDDAGLALGPAADHRHRA